MTIIEWTGICRKKVESLLHKNISVWSRILEFHLVCSIQTQNINPFHATGSVAPRLHFIRLNGMGDLTWARCCICLYRNAIICKYERCRCEQTKDVPLSYHIFFVTALKVGILLVIKYHLLFLSIDNFFLILRTFKKNSQTPKSNGLFWEYCYSIQSNNLFVFEWKYDDIKVNINTLK